MTISTVPIKPFTLNVLVDDQGVPVVETLAFTSADEAIRAAREEVKWSGTVHVTVTDERTGAELFDQAGDFAV